MLLLTIKLRCQRRLIATVHISLWLNSILPINIFSRLDLINLWNSSWWVLKLDVVNVADNLGCCCLVWIWSRGWVVEFGFLLVRVALVGLRRIICWHICRTILFQNGICCLLMLSLLSNTILFTIILSLLMHFQSLFAPATHLLRPLIIELVLYLLSIISHWTKSILLLLLVSTVASVNINVHLGLSLPLELLLIKQIWIGGQVTISTFEMGLALMVLLVALPWWRQRLVRPVVLTNSNLSVFGTWCCAPYSISVNIILMSHMLSLMIAHATYVSAAVFEGVHGFNCFNASCLKYTSGLAVSTVWHILIIYSQIVYLRE